MRNNILIVATFLLSSALYAEDGKAVFERYCWGCHHQTAMAFGPPFKEIAQKRTPQEINAMITDPASVSKVFGYKRNAMPKFELNENQLKSIVDYIKNNPLFKEYNQQRFLESIERKIYIPVNNIITFNHRYIDIKKLRIENIEDNEVIYVKSPMGTGKTNIIQKLQENKKTLIITSRVT